MTATPAPAAHPDTDLWLHQLYGHADGGWLTLFSLNRTTGRRSTDWAPADDLGALSLAAAQREPTSCVWFGAATRRTRLNDGQRGGASECVAIPGLWLDVDIEGPGHAGDRLARDSAHAHALVDSFPLAPTVVIDTGGGLQPWWLFSEMLELDATTSDLLACWGATWARLGEQHGIAVDNVFEAARVMRLPGTTNRKEGLARPVAILSADWQRRYGADDLEQHLDAAPTAPEHRSGGQRVPYIGPERPGDAYNARHSGGDVLTAAGFTLARRDRNGDEHWCRPGKDAREGTSATVYGDDGHTTIWSGTCEQMFPGIKVNRPYDPFGLFTAMQHRGDHAAATKALRASGYGERSSVLDLLPTGTPVAAPVPAESDEPWPEPIPLGADDELPEFPLHTLPDWIVAHADEVADDLQVPVDLPAMLAIGALSTLCSGHLRINASGRWTEDANLYVVVAMPPSTGKSPAYKAMCGPVKELEREYAEQMRATVLANKDVIDSLEGELKRLKQMPEPDTDAITKQRERIVEAERKPTTVPKLTVGDATPEALAKLIADNGGRMALHSTEGGVFDLMAGRYSDRANLDVYLQAWSGDALDTARIGREDNVADVALLTVVLTVQPSVIAALAEKPELAGRGLTARFMYAMPADVLGERDLSMRQRPNTGADDRYRTELLAIGRRMLSWGHPATLHLDHDAALHFYDWRQSLEARRRPDCDMRPLAEWSGKCESSVLRLAAILHIAHGGDHAAPVSLATMAQAIAVGTYWIAHAQHVHDLWGTSEEVRKARTVIAWLRATGTTEFTVRDLYAAHRRLFPTADSTVPVLELLTERGWLRLPAEGLGIGRRGKSGPKIAVSPHLSTEVARHARHARKDIISPLSLSVETGMDTGPRAHGAHGAQLGSEAVEPSPPVVATESADPAPSPPPVEPIPWLDIEAWADDDEAPA